MGRWIRAIALVALLSVSTHVAPAAAPVGSTALSWTPPTQFTDNTLIPVGTTITYRVYRDGVFVTQTTNRTQQLVTEPTGPRCYHVTANIVGYGESTASVQACKTVRIPGPTEGSIEAPTDGGIE